MPVLVKELAIRRYATRFEADFIEVSGTTISVAVRQILMADSGESYGHAIVTVTGVRQFGGTVKFDGRDAVKVAGDGKPEDMNYLKEMGDHLVAVLEELCLCGQVPAQCDCCGSCRGSGGVPSVNGLQQCSACQGRGFD